MAPHASEARVGNARQTWPQASERREKMNEAISARSPRARVVTILLAVLLLLAVLVFVLRPAATSSDPAVRTMSAGGGGSSLTHDPYVARHADVVARYHEDRVR
jgi:hypothetical protein